MAGKDTFGSQLFAGLTGRKGAAVADPSDIKGMLLALGGRSTRTKSGIDLTAAAKKLGVGRRTLERWVKAADEGRGQRPSAGNAKTLRAKARQVASTKAGRRASLKDARVAKPYSRGARVSVRADQGPRAKGRDYLRDRTTVVDLDPAAVEAMLNAYEEGGEKGFMSWATTYWGADDGSGFPGYLEDWQFSDPSDISIEYPHGGGWR
jgi:transposase-like protein